VGGVHHARELGAQGFDLIVGEDADAGEIALLVKEGELLGREGGAGPFAEGAEGLMDFGNVPPGSVCSLAVAVL
jgi:hypothetical protein